MKKIKLPALIILMIVVLASIQLVITHRLATAGEQIRQLEKESQRIEKSNNLLLEELSQIGTLSKISRQAEGLGLVRTTQVIHLGSQVPLALR